MTTTYIYALVDPRTDQIRYVGKTVNLAVRLSQHLANSSGTNRKYEWLQELKALSLLPEIRVLAEVDSENCFVEEKLWIRRMIDDGYDLVNGNMGRTGTATTRCVKTFKVIKISMDTYAKLAFLKGWLGSRERRFVGLDAAIAQGVEAMRERDPELSSALNDAICKKEPA